MANTISYRVEQFNINPNAKEGDTCGDVTTTKFTTLEAAKEFFTSAKPLCVTPDDTVELLREVFNGDNELVNLSVIDGYRVDGEY